MSENREYKSDVFSMLMEDKRYALEVYNALNGSDFSEPEQVEMVRLDKGVSLSVRNDAAFIIDMNISFYEHQSTYNPNIPLRGMIYYANTMERWIKEKGKDLFSRRMITIPTPHFVVFYNGLEKRPEYEEMKLSDAFCHSSDQPGIEVLCRVYNINPSQNEKLKERCHVLEGYTYFVEKVREYHGREETRENAVELAIKDCIEHQVLTDFFQSRKDEVIKMTHLDFTWERREELIRKEEREEGREEGRREARLENLRNMLAAGIDDKILLVAGFSEEEIQRERAIQP